MRRLFYDTLLTWKRIIWLAVAAAIVAVSAVLAPGVSSTSIAFMGYRPEFWMVMGLFISLNCLNAFEAGAKTMIFFLLLQPLILLCQVPFSPLSWGLFSDYPNGVLLTILCFPLGILAFFIKKDNVFSALLLAIITSFLAMCGMEYAVNCVSEFPFELIAAIFCLGMSVALILALLKKTSSRIIAGSITLVAVVFAFCVCYQAAGGHPLVIAGKEITAFSQSLLGWLPHLPGIE